VSPPGKPQHFKSNVTSKIATKNMENMRTLTDYNFPFMFFFFFSKMKQLGIEHWDYFSEVYTISVDLSGQNTVKAFVLFRF
jgi:hypothetical protein